jgi:hypothetical protein
VRRKTAWQSARRHLRALGACFDCLPPPESL